MTATMAKRPRLIIDLPEDVRIAVKLAAMKRDVGISELVTSVLREAFKAEIKDAQKYVPDRDDDD